MDVTPYRSVSPGARMRRLRSYGRRLSREPVTLVATGVFALFLLLALVGPLIAPYGYAEHIPADRLVGPSSGHLFGTDQFGRDVFTRVIVGSRNIFFLAGFSTIFAVVLGTTVGLFSAYYGGFLDEIVTRLLDVLLSIPPLLLGLVLLGTLGSSRLNLILVVALLYLPSIARVVRSMVLDLKTREFVDAARLRGEGDVYIMFREILPSALPPLLVEGSIRFAYSIFLVASLGFLGLGVQPPSPDWGLQINEARTYFRQAPWMLLFPAGAISTLVVSVNLMSDGLQRVIALGQGGD